MPEISFHLPKYSSAMNQLFQEIKVGIEQHDEILSQIQSLSVSHGGITRQVSEPKIVDTPMQRFEAMFEIKVDAFLQTDTDQFAESIYQMINEFHSQQKKYLFEVVGKTSEAVGNVIDAKGRSFWEAYIEMLETLDVEFDENGKPTYQLYVNPNTAKKLEETPPTPEQLRKIEEAMEKKRKNFYARKRSRQLSE
jgi:hypothetical protein